MMKKFDLTLFKNSNDLAVGAAAQWLEKIELARRENRPHHVALSGGRIAKVFFQAVATSCQTRGISLEPVHFFWADERCVPPESPESNFALANELLLDPLRVRLDHIHRIRGEEDPKSAAALASEELQRVVRCKSSGLPVLDQIFLGMGEDGHVASLFPDSRRSVSFPTVYTAVVACKPPPDRVTLTYDALQAARQVCVMVSGSGKEEVLRHSLRPMHTTPLSKVIQCREHTEIMTDIYLRNQGG